MSYDSGWERELSYYRSIITQIFEGWCTRGVHVEHSPVVCIEPPRVCPVLQTRERTLARAQCGWGEDSNEALSEYVPPMRYQLN